MKRLKITIVIFVIVLLSSCHNTGLSGTYIGEEGAFLEKLTFVSHDKVELTFLGTTTEVTYSKEGNKIKINNAGDNQILYITNNGCLDGGGFIGKYCKDN